MSSKKVEAVEDTQEKPFLSVIVHSFFIIPFLIAVFCVLLFAGMHLLTRENRTVYEYLEDVKIGSATKRWQGAFELSKILANPKILPDDPRFISELISAFKQAKHDDNRVRQYLALAMGRTGKKEFVEPIKLALSEEKEENLSALIYALGMLQDKDSSSALYTYLDHSNARIRSTTVVALGNIASSESKRYLKKALGDSEPNVQWGAAVSLAQMGEGSGKNVLFKMMHRPYLEGFNEVDSHEQTSLMLTAIEAAKNFKDEKITEKLTELSTTDKNMKVRAAALAALN